MNIRTLFVAALAARVVPSRTISARNARRVGKRS